MVSFWWILQRLLWILKKKKQKSLIQASTDHILTAGRNRLSRNEPSFPPDLMIPLQKRDPVHLLRSSLRLQHKQPPQGKSASEQMNRLSLSIHPFEEYEDLNFKTVLNMFWNSPTKKTKAFFELVWWEWPSLSGFSRSGSCCQGNTECCLCASEVRVGKKLAVYSLFFLIFKMGKKKSPQSSRHSRYFEFSLKSFLKLVVFRRKA